MFSTLYTTVSLGPDYTSRERGKPRRKEKCDGKEKRSCGRVGNRSGDDHHH